MKSELVGLREDGQWAWTPGGACSVLSTLAHLFVRLLFLVSLPLPGGHSAAGQSAVEAMTPADHSALQRALAAYDQGHSQEAEPALRRIADRYPKNFEAAEALGLIYAEAGNFPSALPLLERACSLRPSMAAARANLGAAYLKLGRPDDAAGALKRSAVLDPRNPQTQSMLGQALLETDHPREAAAALGAAATMDPQNPDILYNWALALFNSGDADRAGKVLESLPGREASAQAQSLWADVAEKQGNYQAAAEHFQNAVSLDSSEQNLYALGLEFMRHWTFGPAIKVYQYGVSKYPQSVRLKLGLGVAKYGNNDFSGAAPVFSELLASDPANAMYANLLGRSCALVSEQAGSGCDKLVEFARQHPQNAEAATFAAASILHHAQDDQDLPLARRLLEQALQTDPKLAEAHFQMAVLDQRQERWGDSVAALEKAVVLRPGFAQAHYRLARAYSHIGKNNEAQQELSLQQKYSAQEKDNLNARLREVTTFLVTMR